MTVLKWLLAAARRAGLAMLMPLALVACGGGGGDAGAPVLGGGDGTPTPQAADLVVVLSTSALPVDGSKTALITVTAVDGQRNAVKAVPVSMSVDSGGVLTPSGKVTNDTGNVSAALTIGSDQSKRTMTVTVTSGSITKTVKVDVVDSAVSGNGPTLTVSLSSNQITPAIPATAFITARSTSGAPLANVVVTVGTVRGGLVNLSATTAMTDASGVARVQIDAGSSGLTGADELSASATVGGVQISSTIAFSVTGASPTLSLVADSTTLKLSTGNVMLRARVLDEKGVAVPGVTVKFSSTTGNVALSATTALSSASGDAVTTMSPSKGGVSGADTLQATATVKGRDLVAQVGVQIVGEQPTLTMTLSNSSISVAQPAQVRVLVRDVAGAVVSGALVSFKADSGLLAFDAATARTDATGVATITAAPLSASTNGADQLTASATVNGIAVTTQQVVQVVAANAPGVPSLQLALSVNSITSGSPATVTATLLDARGNPVPGSVVSFNAVRGLGKLNVGTALTDVSGRAVVQLSPTTTQSAGADEVVASVRYAGVDLQASKGFQIQATNVSIVSFVRNPDPGPTVPLSAYAQTPLQVTLTGAGVDSPVKLSVSSSCVAQGKATVSPASFTTTSNSYTLQYRDNGCGALQSADQLQLVIDGTASSQSLTLPIATPATASLAFVQATPEVIYLKGSGLTETSVVTFEVRDVAGNPLPGRVVELRLLTGAGGVTMEGRGVESVNPPSASPFTQNSDAAGRVSVRVNSGTQPTPIRVHAKLQGTNIATVSSNLTVAVGLPSQLNFSLSQTTVNIEGANIDGTTNNYVVIASDRNGNPVPAGTTINFVTEGGQVEASKQIQLVSGLARASSNFLSAEPRPLDGRITIVAYALGEESFIDRNGNNIWDAGEPFQDLGNIFKDRNFDGVFDSAVDEYVPVGANNSGLCSAPGDTLLVRDVSIPSMDGTCDNTWTGMGQVYVRRAVETVLSTSMGRPLWLSTGSHITKTGTPIQLRTTGNPAPTPSFTPVSSGDTVCLASPAVAGSFSLIVADANPIRLNPMAAGTVVTASTPTTGLSVTASTGTYTVANTSEAPGVPVFFSFDPTKATSGVVSVSFKSPSGATTTVSINVRMAATCP